MTSYMESLEGDLLRNWRAKSQKRIYQEEPEAWLWDILGFRHHEKQREMDQQFLDNRRLAVKSANGTGKSRWVGEVIIWGTSTHDPGTLLTICSAPTMRQIEEVIFAYVASNYGRMKARGHSPIGRLTSSTWVHQVNFQTRPTTLVLGQKPSDKDIVGSFQGIRAVGTAEDGTAPVTWVMIDEGGAVHADLFVAAEAVTTGAGDNKIVTIGNPDSTGTYFQRIFTEDKIKQDWATNTIAAHHLPTFTGEIVYPDNPELQEAMLTSGMIDPEWVEQKKRAWGEDSARYLSKVMGEFPDGDDWSFFPQSVINMAEETEIEPEPMAEVTLGVDLADGGADDSKAYVNIGGHIRHRKTWNEGNESVSRIHEEAIATDATVVVMDRIGVGAGVYNALIPRTDRYYTVIGAKASWASPDPARWANARAYWYDMLREAMLRGDVDLDYTEEDGNGNEVGKALKDQLLSINYDFNAKGAIQLETKKEMHKRGVPSPDDLDAVVFSFGVKGQAIAEDPLAGLEGQTVLEDPWDELEDRYLGMPI